MEVQSHHGYLLGGRENREKVRKDLPVIKRRKGVAARHPGILEYQWGT